MEKEQNTYLVDLESIQWGDENIAFVGGANIGEALDTALWEYGDSSWIIAIDYYPEPHDGQFMLVDGRGFDDGRVYPNKVEAIQNNDQDGEILIAVPKRA